MIVEYIRYTIEPGRADAFRQAYAEAAGILQADPRCLSYEIAQGLEEPTHFVVRIEWDSLEGHLDGFRKDPAFGGFFALVRPYVDDIEEMHHYEVQTTSPGLPEKGLPDSLRLGRRARGDRRADQRVLRPGRARRAARVRSSPAG